jgi:GR25 family glycosyltransferase involved in LPS biosynthesis
MGGDARFLVQRNLVSPILILEICDVSADEGSDYVYALEKCRQSVTPYIAIFEDDIVFADGWLARTRKALREISEREDVFGEWLYLPLFYTETSLSWQTAEDSWYRHIGLTNSLFAFSSFVILLTARHTIPGTRSYLDDWTLLIICLVSTPAFVILAFVIGKYSLFPLHGVVTMNGHGCCTQGLVFPSGQVPDIGKFLQAKGKGQTNTLLEEYADMTGKQRSALAPQVLQHVGLESSRDNNAVNTKSTWAFWFEENEPEALKRVHALLVGG